MPSRVRTKLADVAASLDGLASRLAYGVLGWALWPILHAMSLGGAIWVARHFTQLNTLDTNKLPLADTLWMLAHVVGALVGILFLYGGAFAWARRKDATVRFIEVAGGMNRRLAPLFALPFVAALALPSIERDSPKLTFFYIAIASAVVARGVYAWARAPGVEPAIGDDAPRNRERRAKILAALCVAAIWAFYGIFFSRLSIINHHAFNTRTIDLGYYDNIFYQSIHGRPLGCTLIKTGYHGSAHFDPLLVVLSPLYLIYPHAEMLLVLQAVWLGAGVVPLYLLAHEKIGRRVPAVILAAMYVLYPALQGANMYEFHSLSLLSSILLWLLYFLEKGSLRGYYLMMIPALLCREDASLILCFVGFYCLISGRPRMARAGWVTILVSVVYFVLVKRFFMTSSDIFMSGKDSHSYAYYYEDLIPNKNGVAGLVLSVVTNPVFVLKTMFAEAKVQYLLTLFVPLLFLPFFARTSRVLLGYGLLFTLLATRTAVFSPAFQYSATILPFAFALTPIALRGIEDGGPAQHLGLDGARLSRAMLAGAFVASLLVSWKFGGILDNQSFHGGFSRVARGLSPREIETYAWLRETVAKIPDGASLGVTNKMGCHASNRKNVIFYPDRGETDYVLLDENELRAAELEKHNKAVQSGKLVQVAKRDKMVLLRSEKKPAAPAASASASVSASAAVAPVPPRPPVSASASAAPAVPGVAPRPLLAPAPPLVPAPPRPTPAPAPAPKGAL